ncbi:hypothetical protein D1871_11230 [Nakamurella silvestris]|nr:hypothetical protein D1871_11230 [Nakamurella silvestris]
MTGDPQFTRAELAARIRATNAAIDKEFDEHGRPTNPYITLKPDEHTPVCWAGAIGAATRVHRHGEAEVIALAAVDLYDTDPEQCICPKYDKRGHRIRNRPAV